jgi:hypothetical protein
MPGADLLHRAGTVGERSHLAGEVLTWAKVALVDPMRDQIALVAAIVLLFRR